MRSSVVSITTASESEVFGTTFFYSACVDAGPVRVVRVRRVMPASLVRLSISALIATIRVLPDMANAAISGLSKTGDKMPAANGKAMTL